MSARNLLDVRDYTQNLVDPRSRPHSRYQNLQSRLLPPIAMKESKVTPCHDLSFEVRLSRANIAVGKSRKGSA